MSLSSVLEATVFQTSLFSMWGALVLHWCFPLHQSHYHPITLWQHIASAISEKVNHHHYSKKQQQLSGMLAFLLMWFCAFFFLYIVKTFLWNAWLFDLVFLWLALGIMPHYQMSVALKKLFARAQKPAARMLLAKHIKRETTSLSDTELIKAGCETLCASFVRNLFMVLFFFAFFGGMGAFLYTLLVQLHREWTPRLPTYRYFGQSVSHVLFSIEWLPVRIFSLFLASGKGFSHSFLAIKTSLRLSNIAFIWSMIGHKYQIALGGTAIYDEVIIKRKHLGGMVLAKPEHFLALSQELNQKAVMLIILQSGIMLLQR